MKISIRVKVNARKNEVKLLDDNTYVVSVTAPPVEGKANEEVIEILSQYFRKPKRCIRLIRGATSRIKLFEISD